MAPRRKRTKTSQVPKDDDKIKVSSETNDSPLNDQSLTKEASNVDDMLVDTQDEEDVEVNDKLDNKKPKQPKRKTKSRQGTRSKSATAVPPSDIETSSQLEKAHPGEMWEVVEAQKSSKSQNSDIDEPVNDFFENRSAKDEEEKESDAESQNIGSTEENGFGNEYTKDESPTRVTRKRNQSLKTYTEDSDNESDFEKGNRRKGKRNKSPKKYVEDSDFEDERSTRKSRNSRALKEDSSSDHDEPISLRTLKSKPAATKSTRARRNTSILNGSYKLSDNEDGEEEGRRSLSSVNSARRPSAKRTVKRNKSSTHEEPEQLPNKKQRKSLEAEYEPTTFNLKKLTVPVEKLNVENYRIPESSSSSTKDLLDTESHKADIFTTMGVSLAELMRERLPKDKAFRLFEKFVGLVNKEAGD